MTLIHLLWFAAAVIALVVLIESGKRIVRSVSRLARGLGMSEFVLSFALIAFATSMPELSVGINAALSGVPDLSFGDIVGTNIINITLVLGVVAVVGGGVAVRDYNHFSSNRLFQLTVVLAPLILLLDGTLSRIDSVILFVLLAWYLVRLLDIDDRILGRKVLRPHLVPYVQEEPPSGQRLWKQAGILAVALACMVGATYVIVHAATVIMSAFSLSAVAIGVLIIATITSFPELVIGVRSARAKSGGIALGDVFGAAAINATLTLGVVALIQPIVLTDLTIVYSGIIFTILAFILVFWFLHTKRSLARWEGVVLVLCYCLFVGSQLILI